jgi:hypothetical protein
MRIRSISDDELPAFAASALSNQESDQEAYVRRLLEQGATRLDWCFRAEHGGRSVGRVALWTLPAVGKPLSVILLDTEDDRIAASLLDHAISVSRHASSDELQTVVDEPPQSPQWQIDPERRVRWLAAAGFEMRRATTRWERPIDAPLPHAPDRLTFATLADVGESVFVDALARVSAESLDRYTRHEREQLGPRKEARKTFDDLAQMEWAPTWWEVAVDHGGALVGLVMPTVAPSFGTIGYIGVVPEQRGHRYVDDLLARGTGTLLSTGASALRADSDLDNEPMAAAFVRADWRSIGTRREFRLPLGPIRIEG